MKKIIFIAIISCTVILSCKQSSNVILEDFTGVWLYESDNKKDDLPEDVFSLDLRIENDKIIGQYNAISDYGNRIDSSNDDNLCGVLKENELNVQFTSANGYKNIAVIKKIDYNTISWFVISQTNKVNNQIWSEYYCPDKAILKRYK